MILHHHFPLPQMSHPAELSTVRSNVNLLFSCCWLNGGGQGPRQGSAVHPGPPGGNGHLLRVVVIKGHKGGKGEQGGKKEVEVQILGNQRK